MAGTLRLLVALALAIVLMVLDHRGGWLSAARAQAERLVQPLWRVAGLPAKLGGSMREDAATRARLAEENRILRNALLVSGARLARLRAEAAENARLRGLLGAAERGNLDVQLAPILDIALDPTRQRLTLDIGARQGVREGQAVIDAGGLVGQVIEVRPTTATVLLLTDPDHAVPVAVARSGIRLIAYGRGDRVELANVPLSSDVKVGDQIISSGLGGRFPAGFPVGTITRLRPDESRAFLIGDIKPAAQLDRGRDVLLLRSIHAPAAPAVSPPPSGDPSTASAGSTSTSTATIPDTTASSPTSPGPTRTTTSRPPVAPAASQARTRPDARTEAGTGPQADAPTRTSPSTPAREPTP